MGRETEKARETDEARERYGQTERQKETNRFTSPNQSSTILAPLLPAHRNQILRIFHVNQLNT